MKLYLSNNCHFIEGAKNAAIYDLNNGHIYAINEYGKKLLNNTLKDKKVKLSKLEKDYLNKLIEIGLLKDTNDTKISKPINKITPSLEFAWLELTEICNLKCVHCYGEFGCPKIIKDSLLTLEDWKKIIDQLLELGCRSIQLIGGEPMAYKYFYEVLNYAHDKGMKRIDVFTNATLFDEKLIDNFVRCNVNVRVSVYGYDAISHESVTKQKGSFEKNKNALLLLKKYNIKTSIAIILMKENENYLNDIKNYLNSIGYKYNGYDVIRPSSPTTMYNHSVSNYELLKCRYYTKPDFKVNYNIFNNNHYWNACWNSKIAITATGEILPCVFVRDISAGNIKKNEFIELKDKMLEIWGITKDKIEGCKECEYRYACHDCRPLAIGINGDINSKYPRCCYNPKEGIWEDIEKSSKEIQQI